MYYKRMDIVLVDFGGDHEDSRIGDYRPAIVISNNRYNYHSPVMQVLPMTKKLKLLDKEYHVFIDKEDCDGLTASGVCMVEQIQTVDQGQVKRKIAAVNEQRLADKIDMALKNQLGFGSGVSGDGF